MLEIPTLRQLATQAEEDLAVEADRRLRPALQSAIAWALAGIGYLFLKILAYLSKQLFLDTADEEWALQHASVDGVGRKPAIAASGSVLATGDDGTVYPIGTVLQYSDGREYLVAVEGTIASGEAQLSVTASEAGTDGDLTTTGATLTFSDPPVGSNSTALVLGSGITGGADIETPAALQARTLQRRRAPRRGGSEQDYEIWAKEVGSVENAWATGSYAGIGTVLVIIAAEWDPTDPLDTPVPGSELIAEVTAYIGERKPAGLWLVSVEAPTLRTIDPQILLDPDTTDIRTSVTKALARYLATVSPGGTVYFDDMMKAINRATGEGHHLLQVPDELAVLGVNNVVLESGELAVPGTIDWTG